MQGKENMKIEQQEEEQDLDWVLDLMTTDPFGHDVPKVVNFNENTFAIPSSISPNSPKNAPFPAPVPQLQKIKSMAAPPPIKPDPDQVRL